MNILVLQKTIPDQSTYWCVYACHWKIIVYVFRVLTRLREDTYDKAMQLHARIEVMM
jgi:hypothetical protein